MLTLAYRCRLIAAMVSRAGASASQGHRLSRDLSVGSVLLIEFVEQRLGVFEVGCVKAFSEPAVDRHQEIACLGLAALVTPEPGEACGGAQFPELGLLLPRDVQSFAIQSLGGFGISLPKHELAFASVQLGYEPAPARSFRNLYGFVEQSHSLFNLPCEVTCPR